MVTKFVLLSAARSGSTWVIDMLNSHPEIRTYEELFLRAYKEKLEWAGERDILPWNAYWVEQRRKHKEWLKPRARFKYLDEVYSLGGDGVEAIGFKLMYYQARRHPDLLAYLRLNRVSIVHLIRTNFLDVILSEETSAARGLAHSVVDVERVEIVLDTSTLLDRLKRKDSRARWARKLFAHIGVPYLEVTYEELVSERAGFDAILAFLGIEADSGTLASSLKKLNKGSQRALIENYESVEGVLRGTNYHSLLR